MLCRRTTVFPVECVIRGYLSGSAWKEYSQASGTLAGEKLARTGWSRAPSWSPRSSVRRPRPRPAMTRTSPSRGVRESLGDDVSLYAGEHDPRGLYARREAQPATRASSSPTPSSSSVRDRDGRIILIDEVMSPDSFAILGRRMSYKPGEADSRASTSSRCAIISTAERRAGRWNGDAPAPPLPAQRGRRHQQALSRSLSPHHRRMNLKI